MSGRAWLAWALAIVLVLIILIVIVQGSVFVPSAAVVGA